MRQLWPHHLVSGRARTARTTIPHACGQGLGGVGPFLGARHIPAQVPVGHHSLRVRQVGVGHRPADWVARQRCQAALAGFSTAPLGTSPWVTNLQSAASSFRASATMAMRLTRPFPSRTRSRYQALKALSGGGRQGSARGASGIPTGGWLRSHSQASCPMALRTRLLPALEMPCSWSMPPLCHGLGASPA